MEILGHRGWPAPAHPENTLAAFGAALAAGADGVELDVRLSRDGTAVCAHDADLQRSAGMAGRVADLTCDELQAVPLLGGGTVPRLVDAVALTAGRGRLVLDLKPEPRVAELVDAALGALAAGGCSPADVVLSSFDPGLLDAFAVTAPGLSRALLLDVGDDVRAGVEHARVRGHRAVHVPERAVLSDSSAVRSAVVAGLDVRVWTVNRVVDARLCEVLGVCGVITDVPDVLHAGRRAGAAA